MSDSGKNSQKNDGDGSNNSAVTAEGDDGVVENQSKKTNQNTTNKQEEGDRDSKQSSSASSSKKVVEESETETETENEREVPTLTQGEKNTTETKEKEKKLKELNQSLEEYAPPPKKLAKLAVKQAKGELTTKMGSAKGYHQVEDNVEDEFALPLLAVQRILKTRIPEGINVATELKSSLGKAAGIFVLYITAAAHDICRESRRSTIAAKDIIEALRVTNFESFTPPLEACLEELRKSTSSIATKKRKAASLTPTEKAKNTKPAKKKTLGESVETK